ncbi:MAG: zinc-dependent metalloprotease [Methanolobus sp.]|nr:zinc-dependent metalloprotease [Methanolobus sp.]
MKTKRTAMSLFLVAILCLSVVFVPLGSAKNITKEKEKAETIGTPWFESGNKTMDKLSRLSTDELRELAKTNETVRKIIEEDLKPDGAKIESIEDLKCLPENYSEDLKKAAVNDLKSIQSNQTSVSTKSIESVYVWIVADEEYRSHFGSNWQQEAYDTIEAADNAFYSDHDINFIVGKYSEWDSNDNEDGTSALIDEAESESGWLSNQQGNDMLAIFTNQATDTRGRAEPLGDAWIMKHQISFSWDWHVAQHEASHNYGCPDHGYSGPVCIQTYTYMMTTDNWCTDCDTTIENNRYHF